MVDTNGDLMNKDKVDILAIGVHPDDIELSCSGTVLRQISLGNTVAICDLTQGELGTRGSAELRLIEAAKSKEVLGVSHRVNLKMADGFFEITKANTIKIIEVIRRFQPDIILANALEDRHPDHGRAAKLVAEACFYAGLRKIDTGQKEWRPKAVYHYIQDRNLTPDFVVDISDFMDKKIESIQCYSSQFFVPNSISDEPQTPISTHGFFEFVKAKNRSMARSIQADYAEGFNVGRVPGVQDLFDLK